jgi:thiol-disulfide isomerase/thioredoxin
MGKLLGRLKGVDFYRRLPTDLTEATLHGASLSVMAALVMVSLLGAELRSFLATETQSAMVVDRSPYGELLRVNFNISFPSLSCEFATLDVSDALGTKRMNLTKTVRKLPINEDFERSGHYIHDYQLPEIKYDELPADFKNDTVNYAAPLSKADFEEAMKKYSIVVANFYAPWCPWCQRLEPTWEAVQKEVHDKYPESDGRIRFVKIDCTAEVDLCRDHQIMGFPSIRVFRKGHDEIFAHGFKEHESYKGDRTKESLLSFADTLVPSAGQPHYYIRGVTRVAKSSGCQLSGFVLVKKVPGTLHFLAKSAGHSFDPWAMNMSHAVGYMYFGNKPSPRRRKALETYHPLGLTDDWSDKLSGEDFYAINQKTTFEHYMQVVLTSIQPSDRNSEANFDAYEYTVHSHMYNPEDTIPAAKFSYALSPIQIIVTEKKKAFYHFVTTLCAIIGGVFTVAGILDGMVHQAGKIAKKVDLGKQG